jgi:hypothetical protein
MSEDLCYLLSMLNCLGQFRGAGRQGCVLTETVTGFGTCCMEDWCVAWCHQGVSRCLA